MKIDVSDDKTKINVTEEEVIPEIVYIASRSNIKRITQNTIITQIQEKYHRLIKLI